MKIGQATWFVDFHRPKVYPSKLKWKVEFDTWIYDLTMIPKKTHIEPFIQWGHNALDLLKDVKFFLDAHKSETMLLEISYLYTDATEAKGIFLNEILKVFGDMFFAEADGSDADGSFQVTLGELKTSGKRVMIMSDDAVLHSAAEIWDSSVHIVNTMQIPSTLQSW
jgi:hypothetical protein